MDGVLLLAFVLGFPANEIVLPIAVMGYLAQGSLSGRARAGADARTADRQRLDVDDRRERRAVFPAALAVLDNALDDPARDRQRKWTLLAALLPCSAGHGAVRGVHGAGAG